MRRATGIFTAILLAGTTACNGGATAPGNEAGNASAAPAENATATSEPCADDGPRLALTKLCKGRAVNYLNIADGESYDPPEGCAWEVGEAKFTGDNVLLYRRLQCAEHASQVEYKDGTLKLASFWQSGKMEEPLTIGQVHAITDKAELAKCAARPARIESYPADAMVVDSDPKGSKSANGDPVAVCGDMGYIDEATRFWRVVQGHAFFFDFGQDLVGIDPGSVTIMKRDGDGWTQL